MEKQFYSKSQMPPKAPFKDIYNRYVIPKDTLDENNIQKLFQIIEEGNLGKIREFLMSGNVSVNVRLETGDTLAHVVIKNQNLTERTKTDICNFLVQQGAPIDLPNKYNITPLHLACKYQLLDIIKIFIKSGANMSAVDNNGFTILHYFIMSDIYECKTERNTKVGSFKTKLLTRETFTEQVNAVNKSLISYIYEEPVINQYLMHIQNTLKKNLHNMFPTELYKIHSEFYDIITTDIGSNTPLSEKKNKIVQSTLSTKDKIYDMLNGKLRKSVSPMTIKPNSVNGWGTTPDQKDKILQYSSTQNIIDQETPINKTRESIKNDLIKKKNDIEKCHTIIRDNLAGVVSYLSIINKSYISDNQTPVNIKNKSPHKYIPNNSIPQENIKEILKFRESIDIIQIINLTHVGEHKATLSFYNEVPPKPNYTIKYARYTQNKVVDNSEKDYCDGIMGLTDIGSLSYLYLFHIYYMIKLNINILTENINDLLKCIENEYLYYTYELLITNIVSAILRLAMYISIYHLEIKDYILIKINEIDNLNDKFNKDKYIKALHTHLTTGDKSISVVLRQIEEIYGYLYEIMNILNTYIMLLNYMSAERVMSVFTKDLDTHAYKLDKDIYNRPFQNLRVIPKTRDLFVQQFDAFDNNILFPRNKQKLTTFIKILVERYMPQLTFLNHPSYIIQNVHNLDNFTTAPSNANMTTIHHNNHTVLDSIKELSREIEFIKNMEPPSRKKIKLDIPDAIQTVSNILEKAEKINIEVMDLIDQDIIREILDYIEIYIDTDNAKEQCYAFCELLLEHPLLANFIANHPDYTFLDDDYFSFIDFIIKYPFEVQTAFYQYVKNLVDFPLAFSHPNEQQLKKYANDNISIVLASLLAFDTPEGAHFVLLDYRINIVNATKSSKYDFTDNNMAVNMFLNYYNENPDNAIIFLETLVKGEEINQTRFSHKYANEKKDVSDDRDILIQDMNKILHQVLHVNLQAAVMVAPPPPPPLLPTDAQVDTEIQRRVPQVNVQNADELKIIVDNINYTSFFDDLRNLDSTIKKKVGHAYNRFYTIDNLLTDIFFNGEIPRQEDMDEDKYATEIHKLAVDLYAEMQKLFIYEKIIKDYVNDMNYTILKYIESTKYINIANQAQDTFNFAFNTAKKAVVIVGLDNRNAAQNIYQRLLPMKYDVDVNFKKVNEEQKKIHMAANLAVNCVDNMRNVVELEVGGVLRNVEAALSELYKALDIIPAPTPVQGQPIAADLDAALTVMRNDIQNIVIPDDDIAAALTPAGVAGPHSSAELLKYYTEQAIYQVATTTNELVNAANDANAHVDTIYGYNARENPVLFFDTHIPYSIAFAKFLLANISIVNFLKFDNTIVSQMAFARVAALNPKSADAFRERQSRKDVLAIGVSAGGVSHAVFKNYTDFVKFMGITPKGAYFAIQHRDAADAFTSYVANEPPDNVLFYANTVIHEIFEPSNTFITAYGVEAQTIQDNIALSKYFILLASTCTIIDYLITKLNECKVIIEANVDNYNAIYAQIFDNPKINMLAQIFHLIVFVFYQHINIYQYDKMPGAIYGLENYINQKELVRQITSIIRMRHIYKTETIGVVPEQSNIHMGMLDEMGSYGQHNLLYLKDNYYKGDAKLKQNLSKAGHTIVIENRANKPKTEEAYPVVGALLDTYIHIIKYWIVRYIIDNIYKTAQAVPTVPPTPIEILNVAIKTYKDKYIEETGVDTIEDNIIYTMIGKMIDTAIMTFIKSCMHQTAVHHTISYMGHMKENKFAAEIFQEIKGDKILLFKPETNYKVELQKLTDALYVQVDNLANADKIYELNYADALMKDKVDDETKNQHIIYNYTYNTKTVANKCSKIVPEVLDILMENGNVRINAKDNSGNTVLYYAVGIQHYAIIEKMLKMNVSVNNSLSRNNIGMTPFEYSLSLYKMHLEIMSDPSQLIKEMNNKVKDYVRKKPEYKNNMIKHGDNIFAQILYMLNHEFYMMSKQYKNSWTYDKHKKLLSDLTKLQITDPEDKVNKAISPIIHYIEKLKSTGANGTQAIEGRKQYADIQIKKLTEEISECNERIKSLTAEQTDIASKLGDKYYQDRNAEINDLIADIQKEIVEKQTKLTTWESRKKESETNFTKFTPTIVQEIEGRKTLEKAKRADVLYESIFKEVINKQIPDVARQVLDSLQDQTFIDGIINDYIIASNKNNNKNIYIAIKYYIKRQLDPLYENMRRLCFIEILNALEIDGNQKIQIGKNNRLLSRYVDNVIYDDYAKKYVQDENNIPPDIFNEITDIIAEPVNNNIKKAIEEAAQIAYTQTKLHPMPSKDEIKTMIETKINIYIENMYKDMYKRATKYIFDWCNNKIISYLSTIMKFSQSELGVLDSRNYLDIFRDSTFFHDFLLDPQNYDFTNCVQAGSPAPDSLNTLGLVKSTDAVIQAIDFAVESVRAKFEHSKRGFAVILDTIVADILDIPNIKNKITIDTDILTTDIATLISKYAYDIVAPPPAAAPLAAALQIAKFKYTNDKDYESYKILWDLYIKDTKKNDTLMNLHIILLKYAKKLISEYEMKKMGIKEIKDNVETIYELHDGLLNRFASDYDTLPLEYSEQENYALTRALDILVHVVRHNICTTMYNVIAKNLALYVMNTHEFNHGIIFTDEKEYSRYINGIVDEILSNGKHDEKLMAKYVIGDMPKKAVKIITGIYEGDDDPDRLIGRVLNLFKQITDILMLNNTVKIESTSPIIRMLDDVFYPYFEDLLTQYITDGKNMVDSYMKYIMTETRQIRIMKQCAEQAMKETDIQQ